ncbi:MAG TPA: glycosyltransferase family 4 protein [Candidatus Dormibacteraeota bacterium]|nr:glycosyltransferase family 4 protein [Candidatus Dormibacteraeota bacterium]
MEMGGRYLMLVSARAGARLREDVGLGRRPCPEYLRLEQRHGVELLDWSRLRSEASGRSVGLSVAHARTALRRLDTVDAVFSDGEHLGVPLALAMRLKGLSTPHLMLGHHLTTQAKRRVFRLLRPQARISRVLVHSRRQLELAASELGIPRQRLAFVPYGVDADFWSPTRTREEKLVVSVGREHRDYATLARACSGLPGRVFVAAGSLFSPSAPQDQPRSWPANFDVGFAEPADLRDWYARASVVVVPLVPNEFQAGVTTILEAMAMAKAVVVTATAGQRDLIEDGMTGLLVPPDDASAMRQAATRLLADPQERRRLGDNARQSVQWQFGLDRYADCLAQHLDEISHTTIGISGTAAGRVTRT